MTAPNMKLSEDHVERFHQLDILSACVQWRAADDDLAVGKPLSPNDHAVLEIYVLLGQQALHLKRMLGR